MPQDRRIRWAFAAWLALSPFGPACAGEPGKGPARPAPTASRDVPSMASRIDELVEARLARRGSRPPPSPMTPSSSGASASTSTAAFPRSCSCVTSWTTTGPISGCGGSMS